MNTREINLFKHKSKTQFYIKNARRRWEDLYPSVQYFLKRENLDNQSILEVACATGGMYEILKKKHKNITFTGLDISPDEIKVAKKRYPEARFIRRNFYQNRLKDNSFDTVLSFLVVNHQKDYKKFFSELIRVAKKRIIFDARFQYDYPTSTDLDLSYLYYHGSGKRNYFVCFNFYELFNYLNIETFNLKKISVHGYYTPQKSSTFVPFPKSKMIAAAFCLEKHDPKTRVKRQGGHPQFAKRSWCEYKIDLPDFSMNDI